jgi:hypothetical protein
MAPQAPNGFECSVLTNNPLALTVQSGTAFAGGNTAVTTPTTTLVLGASTTTYVYFNPQTGSVTSNTSGFVPGTLPIAIVTTSASAISGIQDVRSVYSQPDAGALFFTSAGVVTTCNSTVQNITTFALPSGLLNQAGKTIRLKAWGILNTTSASGLQLGVQLNTINVVVVNTFNITTSLTNQPWNAEMMIYTANTGVTGNVYGHGTISAQITAAAANTATTVAQDIGTAVSANINLTGPLTLGFIGLTNGAITNLVAQITTLEVLN